MKFQHILMAIFVAAIWGVNFVVVKVGLKEIPPFMYGAGRFLIAAIPALFLVRPTVSWRIIGGIGLTLGVLKFSLMFTGIYLGMSAGLASLVLQSQVFFTIILSYFFFGCRIQLYQVLGTLLAFIGICLIAWDSRGQSTLSGFLLILGAALSWSISNILYQKAGKVDMLSLTAWSSVIPPLPMLACALFTDGVDVVGQYLSNMTGVGFMCLLFTSCASTLIGATLWGELLKNYEAPQVAPFSLLIPLFGMSSAWLLLDEQFSGLALTACVLVFVGLIINQAANLKFKVAEKSHVKVVANQLHPSQNLDKAA